MNELATPDQPPRGFPTIEFERRLERAQRAMAKLRVDAILLSTEPEFRYFSGFQSQFWESPTRPWFLIVPASGKPIAVVPEIGAAGISQTWVDDIRTWPSPRPEDEGVSLLESVLKELPAQHGRVGMQLGPESHLRMSTLDFLNLRDRLSGIEIVDCQNLIQRLRVVKSEAEIDKIRYICQLASSAFETLPEKISHGQSERDICRTFKLDMIARGADSVPYMIAESGPGSYSSIIMGPTDRILNEGDTLIIDTGGTFDGYFCDFDRNYAFGKVHDSTHRAHAVVYAATDAGFAAARPGATTSDVWQAMWNVLEAGGALGNDVGRMGHGLGMQLTEWPSNKPDDHTVLEAGMVLTLEPGMCFAENRLMVHEENIVIREEGAEMLSRRAPAEMPAIE